MANLSDSDVFLSAFMLCFGVSSRINRCCDAEKAMPLPAQFSLAMVVTAKEGLAVLFIHSVFIGRKAECIHDAFVFHCWT